MSEREPSLPHQESPNFRRMPDEVIEDIQTVPFETPEKHVSALQAILKLTSSPRAAEIGKHGPSNAAGVLEANKDIPELNLYGKFYLRDAHVVASILNEVYPELTRATIVEALTYTGVREQLRSAGGPQDEQEVGKVPHEIRGTLNPEAEARAKEKDRGYPYYGAIDTTSKNSNAIARMCLANPPESLEFLNTRYEGLDGKEHSIEDTLHDHINWIRKRMTFNNEGLIESLWINKKHHANQSWADSPDAFHHGDGTWASHHPDKNWGVAAVEVQAETYDALLNVADVYKALADQSDDGRKEFLLSESNELEHRGTQLRKAVMSHFWVEDPEHFGGYFARGTDRDEDGNVRPLRIRSSDMGHLLNSKLLDGNDDETSMKREATILNLFSNEMLCPNGIRTLSSDSIRYRDTAYHNGSSWPWTSYYIAKGLERHGYFGLAYELKKRVWSFYNETKTLAEYGTGSSDPTVRINTDTQVTVFDASLNKEPIYHFSRHKIVQPPQEIQAWSAATILALKHEHNLRRIHPEKAIPTEATDEDKRAFERSILHRVSTEFTT